MKTDIIFFLSYDRTRILWLSTRPFYNAGAITVNRTAGGLLAPELDNNFLGFQDYMRSCGVTQVDIKRLLGPKRLTFYWRYDWAKRCPECGRKGPAVKGSSFYVCSKCSKKAEKARTKSTPRLLEHMRKAAERNKLSFDELQELREDAAPAPAMAITVEKCGPNNYRAEWTNRPGSPAIGTGWTAIEAMAALMFRYLNLSGRLTINGKPWRSDKIL